MKNISKKFGREGKNPEAFSVGEIPWCLRVNPSTNFLNKPLGQGYSISGPRAKMWPAKAYQLARGALPKF